ncbi:MAG: hypothetical protein KDK91_04580 [Gammaproteobacteria bacterium]|nr:hypothetical protein [Gammaproteobacteria bacterium]
MVAVARVFMLLRLGRVAAMTCTKATLMTLCALLVLSGTSGAMPCHERTTPVAGGADVHSGQVSVPRVVVVSLKTVEPRSSSDSNLAVSQRPAATPARLVHLTKADSSCVHCRALMTCPCPLEQQAALDRPWHRRLLPAVPVIDFQHTLNSSPALPVSALPTLIQARAPPRARWDVQAREQGQLLITSARLRI